MSAGNEEDEQPSFTRNLPFFNHKHFGRKPLLKSRIETMIVHSYLGNKFVDSSERTQNYVINAVYFV